MGDEIIISGAVSMNDSGIIVGAGSMEQQMKNCYSDLEKSYNIMVALLMMYMPKTFTQPTWPIS